MRSGIAGDHWRKVYPSFSVFEDKFTTESKGAVIGSIFDPPFVSKYMVG
jgi:hypothetical protein